MPAPPAIINPITGQPTSAPASWQPTTWGTANYSAPTVNYGASGVAPAGGMNLTSLANYMNSLNRQGQTAALRERIPGGPALETTSSGNIASELAGQVSPSTIRLLQQQAAERGVATGAGPASDNANAAYLQALGLTSIQLQEQGQRDLTAAEGRNPAAPLYDPSTQLLTPYQSGQLNLEAQRIAEGRSSGVGGGGYVAPRVIGGESGGGGFAPTTSTGTTGADVFGTPDFSTGDWLASLGYTQPTPGGPLNFPGPTGIPGEQGSTLFDYGNVQVPGAISPATPAQETGVPSWEDIFASAGLSPDLGT